MQTTSTKLVVTVNLDATKQSEAVVGGPVTVQMPDGTTLDGKITAVSPVAQSSSTSSSSSSSGAGGSSTPTATVPITITLRNSRHVNGLDQAAVSVNFEQQKAKNVLSVPVSALLATAGGGYDVQEATAPHRLIPVTPGLFAAGFVQISGPQISPGLQVTDSQG
jgi:multidrug efflux pump subunit AcrA (membrane-fusion protein)